MASPGRAPLIELMRDRTGVVRPPSARPQDNHTDADDDHLEPRSFLSPGRVIRVPVGYLLVGLAGFVALGVGAYSIGYQVGQQRARERIAQLEAAGSPPVATQDPLMTTGEEPSASGADKAASAPSDRTASGSSAVGAASADSEESSANPANGDPRTPGMNYFIVAYYPPGEAARAAAFLRDNGVEAAVVQTNSERFRYVVSLKGFPAGTLDSAEARRHEALLRQLGRRWKRDHNGPSDFSDMWALKHQPE